MHGVESKAIRQDTELCDIQVLAGTISVRCDIVEEDRSRWPRFPLPTRGQLPVFVSRCVEAKAVSHDIVAKYANWGVGESVAIDFVWMNWPRIHTRTVIVRTVADRFQKFEVLVWNG